MAPPKIVDPFKIAQQLLGDLSRTRKRRGARQPVLSSASSATSRAGAARGRTPSLR